MHFLKIKKSIWGMPWPRYEDPGKLLPGPKGITSSELISSARLDPPTISHQSSSSSNSSAGIGNKAEEDVAEHVEEREVQGRMRSNSCSKPRSRPNHPLGHHSFLPLLPNGSQHPLPTSPAPLPTPLVLRNQATLPPGSVPAVVLLLTVAKPRGTKW